jgi:hypothetical protein
MRQGWAIAVVLTACGARAPRGPASTTAVVASLERLECFGECPIYKVTVYADGTVQYDGKDHVKVKGRRVWQIEPATIEHLRESFARVEFGALPDYPNSDCTDLPRVVLALDGHEVRHNLGDAKAPEELQELEITFDMLVKDQDVVGPPGEPYGSYCY